MTAEEFAAKIPQYRPTVWRRGVKVRVYLKYPRTELSPGGGDLGYVDFSSGRPVLNTRLTPEQAAEIRAALK